MTIRKDALTWYKQNVGDLPIDRICTSKIYLPEKSWTKKLAWWIEIPLDLSGEEDNIWFVLQKEVDSKDFYSLRVPTTFIKQQSEHFRKDEFRKKFSFFISAENDSLFKEVRGSGKIDFNNFYFHLK